MKKKIILIGKNGFIGSYLEENFTLNGWEILGLSRDELSLIIKSKKNFYNLINKFPPDVVILNAAIAHQSKYTKLDPTSNLYFVNIEIPKLIAKLIREIGNCRMIFISSIGVHGSYTKNKIRINEQSPICPENPYSLSKYIAEMELKKIFEFNKSLLTIIRPSLVYGHNPPGNLKSLIKLIDLSIPLPFKNIENRKSFLSINTLFLAIKKIIEKEKFGGKTYVLSDREIISTKDLISKIAVARNKKIILFEFPKFLQKIIKFLPLINKLFSKLSKDFEIDPTKIYTDLKLNKLKNQEAQIKLFLRKYSN